jgi:hypothetical protein
MAAGATIGSNHNSRGADGELIAGRGFWPGLCVSVKHNSRFASFIIMAKGDYPAELDIPLPFSLVSNDTSKDELVIMPAYWFIHNMYALARNAWKYADRDKRLEKIQLLEYDYLAPDSVQELASAIENLQLIVARCWLRHVNQVSNIIEKEAGSLNLYSDDAALKMQGKQLLENKDESLNSITFLAEGFENSSRKVRILKLIKGYSIYMELIIHYALEQILVHLKSGKYDNLVALQESLPENKMPETWINVGGQFIKKSALDKMLSDIRQNRIDNWNDIHQFYLIEGKNYQTDKLHHALDILWQVHGISFKKIKPTEFKDLLFQSVKTAEWITKGIFSSREKDYLNPFRKMVYENQAEMNQVLGKLDDNSFIKNQDMTLREYKSNVQDLIQKWKLN